MKFCHGIAEGVAEKGRGVYITHFSQENVYYRPQKKFAKVMFLDLCVSHSVHRGVCIGRGGQSPPLIGYYGIQSTSGRYVSY